MLIIPKVGTTSAMNSPGRTFTIFTNPGFAEITLFALESLYFGCSGDKAQGEAMRREKRCGFW